jgi:hypothetical protein
LNTIGPNLRAIVAIAACASAFVAYGRFVHRFFAIVSHGSSPGVE